MAPDRSRPNATDRWLSRCVAGCLGLIQAGFTGQVYAAHPLQTEDTGTQGTANIEFENGLAASRSGDARLIVYQPQFSFGATPALDLIVQPSWIDSRPGDGRRLRGLGDTNLDVKWRFFGSAPWSFAVRAGAAVATNEHGLGLEHGTLGAHMLLVTTVDLAPFTFHGNLGYTRNPHSSGQRMQVASASAAVMWAPNERLTWTVDGGSAMDSDPTRNRWVTTLLAGAIYTIRPGLDVDAGYQSSVRASVPAHEWLVGLTYRFGL
jgi:hypothetical protein